MKRFVACLTAAVTLAAIALDDAGRNMPAQEPSPRGLDSLFSLSHGLVRDTNADGLADAVAARIIVPAQPTVEDTQAAINIAARLGFETTALTLPIVLRDDEVSQPPAIALPIMVGRENAFVKKLAEQGAIDLKTLAKGQGLVAQVRSPLGGGGGLVVVGGDDEGTLAAATVLAARLPRLWTMSGIKLAGIEEETLGYLKTKGITASAAAVESVVVDSDRRGIAGVKVRLQVPAALAFRAVNFLQELDLAHRKGMEPRTLNFANIATTSIQIAAQDKNAGLVELRRSGLNSRTLTPPIDPDELAPDSPGERGRPAEALSAPAKPFDLSNVYSIDGWLGDSYADLIPDRTDTSIVIGAGRESLGAAHIAARLALESTGVTIPIAKADAKVREANREASPILVGAENSLVKQLVKIGKTRLDNLEPGDGLIHLVARAFGNATATVVAGADTEGTDAASIYLARRNPYLWDVVRGAFSLDDLKTQAARFLQARNAAGQASQALSELDSIRADLKGKEIESLEAKLYLEKANPELDRYLESWLKESFQGASVKVSSQGVTDPVTVFEDKLDLPWEVDEFWSRVRADVLPRIEPGSKVEVEARLSESPEVRRAIAAQAVAELQKAGARDARVRVLSAYKQGFLWLTEQVIPELKGKGIRSVHLRIATHKPDLSKKYKFYMVPTRWLHELYPVDEIFQRELGIARESFTLEMVEDPKEIYTLEARDAAGKPAYQSAFSPKFVEREYLDQFPGWSRVEVTTGWLTAAVDGHTATDARIQTDPERFWDHYQSKVLPRVHEHVMKVTENRPMPDKQPFYRDLDIEVWMSEPDFRIGIDEEQISSLEALHEDLYFVTLDFFDALGRTAVKRRLGGPGKIYPIIHPDRPGQAGQARILFSGNASSKAKLEISYKEKVAEKPTRETRDLAKIDTTAPIAARIVVRPDRVKEIELQVEAKDDREAARAVDALDALGRLQRRGNLFHAPNCRPTSRPFSLPGASTPTKCLRPAISCGWRSCWSPTLRTRTF